MAYICPADCSRKCSRVRESATPRTSWMPSMKGARSLLHGHVDVKSQSTAAFCSALCFVSADPCICLRTFVWFSWKFSRSVLSCCASMVSSTNDSRAIKKRKALEKGNYVNCGFFFYFLTRNEKNIYLTGFRECVCTRITDWLVANCCDPNSRLGEQSRNGRENTWDVDIWNCTRRLKTGGDRACLTGKHRKPVQCVEGDCRRKDVSLMVTHPILWNGHDKSGRVEWEEQRYE